MLPGCVTAPAGARDAEEAGARVRGRGAGQRGGGLPGHGERPRSQLLRTNREEYTIYKNSYYSSKQVQETCEFWLLTIWL